MESTMVAGEPIDVLVKALTTFKFKKTRAGMFRCTAEMDAELGHPLVRALMRVEAELLVEDADRWGRPEIQPRTPDQRRADALIALVLRVTDAAAASKD